MKLSFFIPGSPQGKGRARAVVRHGQVQHYTPEKTRTYEGMIRTQAMAEMAGERPFEGPISLGATLTFEIPKSWPKWKRELAMAGRILPTVKPDADNVIKAIKDALNGVAWVDDCQVCSLNVQSRYQDGESSPGVEVTVFQLKAAPAQCDKGWLAGRGLHA